MSHRPGVCPLWARACSLVTSCLTPSCCPHPILCVLSIPGLGVCANLVFNLHPTRVRVRYQKRQKLQFETKLGMNSPF